MMRFMIVLAVALSSSISVSIETYPLPQASSFVLEGNVASQDGSPIPGAQIRLLDGSGRVANHAFSDTKGHFRIAASMQESGGETRAPGMEIRHLRFHSIRLADALKGARSAPSVSTNVDSLRTGMLRAATRVVRRDFVLAPEPAAGPMDPAAAEVIYQEALLSLDRAPEKAHGLLELYAQTGANRKQIERALDLIAEIERKHQEEVSK
jgi:hypothetical protein